LGEYRYKSGSSRMPHDMFGQWTYLIWLALFIGLPVLGLGLRGRSALWQQRRALALISFGALAGGWAWDALSVRLGVWYYAPANGINFWLVGLPIEEWLWIVGVTLMFGLLTALLMEKERGS
jgi:lycopene cyclase domain-containing protein